VHVRGERVNVSRRGGKGLRFSVSRCSPSPFFAVPFTASILGLFGMPLQTHAPEKRKLQVCTNRSVQVCVKITNRSPKICVSAKNKFEKMLPLQYSKVKAWCAESTEATALDLLASLASCCHLLDLEQPQDLVKLREVAAEMTIKSKRT